MMREMRSTILSAAVLLVVSGCAHTSDTHESSAFVASGVNAPPSQPQGEIIAVDQQLVQEEAPPARPKLTQTITLGQSNSESAYSAASPAPGQANQAGQAGQGGNNVTVNNNVIVNQPPVYGGWGGYGGYGYSGRGGGFGVRADGAGRSSGSRGGATWGNTGWEGARGRPAGAGATPGVGGNWGSAPSYGPSQMR
jgi:hypothetical protein